MNAYIYNADIYCEDCGKEIKDRIRKESNAPENPDDEYSFDSDEFPKGPYSDGGGESDCPEHCASQSDCINGIDLVDPSNGDVVRIGCMLENDLTSDGVEYINEYIRECKKLGHITEVVKLWYDYYSQFYELEPLQDEPEDTELYEDD